MTSAVKTWPLVPLAHLLTPISRPVKLKPAQDYDLLGMHWYAEGLYIKERKPGAQIQADTLYEVQAGDVVYNRLFAWKGSFGIADASIAGCYVSNEFPCFRADEMQVVPAFLLKYLSQAYLWDEVGKISSGSTPTSRLRLKEAQFLGIEMPLPPLEEQRRIVARIDALAGKIEEARGLRREAEEDAERLTERLYGVAWAEAEKMTVPGLLESIADVIDPQPDHRTPPEVMDGMPYVSIANISLDGKVDTYAARKVSPLVIERQEASFRLRTGDIVLGKIGTIGAARPVIVEDRISLSANVVLVQPNRTKISDKLLLFLLRSPQIKEQLDDGTRTSAQGAFGIKKMRKLLIPVPSLGEQHELLSYVDTLLKQSNSMKQLQSDTAAELDALLPSILDKAFKGEL